MNNRPTPWPLRILLAIDGSAHSRAAAESVSQLLLPPGSEVAIYAVLPDEDAPDDTTLLGALQEAHRLHFADGLDVRTQLLRGQPVDELKRAATAYRPDLMVIGAVGLRATLGVLLGGVAQQLVEHARWPVLVVRAPFEGFRQVLLATDGSLQSQAATEFLARFPLAEGVAMTVMHVLPPKAMPAYYAYGGRIAGPVAVPSPEALRAAEEAADLKAEAEMRDGRALVQQAMGVMREAGREVEFDLPRGEAAAEIIQHAASHGTDLVVSGSRGLGAITGWLLGSVSRKLVHEANCSVLVVKGVVDPRPSERTQMSTTKQLHNTLLVSLTDGKLLGEIKDIYLNADVTQLAAVLVRTEGLLNRKAYVIERSKIQTYGADAWLISGSETVFELPGIAGYESFVLASEVIGREVLTEGGTKIGSVGDVLLDAEAKVVGFSLDKLAMVGPLSERKAIARAAITQIGSRDEPMTTILARAEATEVGGA